MRKIFKLILLFFIAINIIYVLSGAVHYPLAAIDVYSIWLLKAREFYINGVLPLNQLNQFPYSHPQYPILLPLVFTFIFKLAGGIYENLIMLIYPLIYSAILFTSYKFFRKLQIKELPAFFLLLFILRYHLCWRQEAGCMPERRIYFWF